MLCTRETEFQAAIGGFSASCGLKSCPTWPRVAADNLEHPHNHIPADIEQARSELQEDMQSTKSLLSMTACETLGAYQFRAPEALYDSHLFPSDVWSAATVILYSAIGEVPFGQGMSKLPWHERHKVIHYILQQITTYKADINSTKKFCANLDLFNNTLANVRMKPLPAHWSNDRGAAFINFIKPCLNLDPSKRPLAEDHKDFNDFLGNERK